MDEPEITQERLERCRQILQQHEKAGNEVVWPPAEIYQARIPTGWAFYINFVHPDDLPVGAEYFTWIVQLHEDDGSDISFFRSRRGENGDETLPPD